MIAGTTRRIGLAPAGERVELAISSCGGFPMITIAMMRAAGISEAHILRVVELEQTERLASRREQNRINKRNQRSRQHVSADRADTPLTVLPSLLSNLPSIDRPLATAAREVKRPLPADWVPKGEQRDPTEADEFRDHALAKGYQYVNWDAAYRNFQRSSYNARNNGGQHGNGKGRRSGSVLDAFDRIGERLKAAGASDDYVPGSSGPRPLELDTQVRPARLKLVPPR